MSRLEEKMDKLIGKIDQILDTKQSTRRSESMSPNRSPVRCYHCNQKGHIRPDCPQKRRERSPSPSFRSTSTGKRCFECGKSGHFQSDCPEKQQVKVKTKNEKKVNFVESDLNDSGSE